MKKGTAIYYTGDMANSSGFGRISKIFEDRWGKFATVRLEDGRKFDRIPLHMIRDEYEGHCGSRFVTRRAYDAWRKAGIERLEAQWQYAEQVITGKKVS